jgi:putative ABC transport system permease protein
VRNRPSPGEMWRTYREVCCDAWSRGPGVFARTAVAELIDVMVARAKSACGWPRIPAGRNVKPPKRISVMTMNTLQDLRYAIRALSKSPGFTAIAALTLALGVGATTAIFSVVNAVMLRPLPFADPDRLVRVWESNLERDRPTFAVSHPNFLDWRAQSRAFESLAATTNAGFTWTSDGNAEVVPGLAVTATFLPTLKILPALGRNFRDDEDRPGGNTRVVLLGDGFWRRAFGGDPAVVGRTITLNAQTRTIIGVLPPTFRWGANSDLLAPLAPDPARNRGDHRLAVIGRVAAGSSIEQARSELATMAAQLAQQYPESNRGWGTVVTSFYDWLIPDTTRRSLLVLLGAVALVLLIACVNVANLLLARAAARQRELAIRVAVGASRGRVVRQLLFEASLISIAAATIGVAIAFASTRLLVALGPDSVPRLEELSIDARVFGFAILVALSTMLIFAGLPAIQAARQDPQDGLRADGRSATSGSGRRRIRAALTIGEVALSVALLIGAGLLMRSFARLQQVEPGFSVSGLMTARVSLPSTTYPTAASRRAFYERFLEDLRGRPGIGAAAISSGPPLSGDFTGGDVRLPAQTNEDVGSTAWRLVSPGYFTALGIPIRGREFMMQDDAAAPPVAIISAALARQYFPNDDAVGRTLVMRSFGDDPHTIIGVAGDVRTAGLDQDAGFVFYGSRYAGWNPMMLAWRASGPSSDTVRASLRSIDPNVPLSAVESMDALLDRSTGPRRFNMYLLGAFAAVSLALAAIGLFGVMAYLVSQRTREIGVRLALGATRGEVFRLILGRGLALALIGATGGVAAALGLTRVMETLLFSVSRTDPVTFVAVPAALLIVAGLACYLPARRAMKVDPVVALRGE